MLTSLTPGHLLCSTDDQSQLSRDDSAGDGVLVASQDGAGCWHLSLPHYGLAPGVPVPQQHGAVLGPTDHVAVTGVVTLRPDTSW